MHIKWMGLINRKMSKPFGRWGRGITHDDAKMSKNQKCQQFSTPGTLE